MSAREMYAPKGWDGAYYVTLSPEPDAEIPSVRVLVQEIPEGSPRPDFKVGDRVRCQTSGYFGEPARLDYEIAHIYFDGERWCFYSTDNTRHVLERFTLIPRETSRLIRVTGPEDGVEAHTKLALGRVTAVALPPGVRVEVVDD